MKSPALLTVWAALLIGGCHPAAPPAEAAKPAADKAATPRNAAERQETPDKESAGVTLSAEQMEKIGLQTEAAKATNFADETGGFGTVLPHESIAQAVAELATAEATEKQSRAALARAQRLTGTAGALSSDVEETSARQAAVDKAALDLARQRLSASFGQKAPWSGGAGQGLLSELARGSTRLVRVTFPLGSLSGDVPQILRVSRIGSAANGKRWSVAPVWAAPADASVPGRSFFAVLRNSDLGEGERILAAAPLGTARAGVLIPARAVAVSEGKYWVYVEDRPGHFLRSAINADTGVDDQYFVIGAVKPGDQIVTSGVALLLAQESNSGADSE